MNRRIGIGIIQMRSELGDVSYNLNKSKQLIKEAADKGSHIVCLPELFTTGYHLGFLKDKTNQLGLEYFDQSVRELSEAARKNKVYLIAPIPEERDLKGVLFNSALVFNDNGKLEGSYAKTHLWALERYYFREGNDYPVFNTPFGNIGIAVCYDAGFPEVSRILALKGADIIFIPSAWRIEDEDMWDLNIPQRALENSLFTVGVNHVLNSQDLQLFGRSKICNPRGRIIKELPADEEKVVSVEINLSEIEEYRTSISYLRDRKPQSYHQILKNI